MRSHLAHVLFGIVLVAGCTSVAPAPTPSESAGKSDAMPEIMRSVLGFDPPRTGADDATWAGQRQLFRVKLEDGDGVRTWWVLATVSEGLPTSHRTMTFTLTSEGVTESVVSRLTSVTVCVQEQGSDHLRLSMAELPHPALESGMFDLCQIYLAHSANDAGASGAPVLTQAQKRIYLSCAASLMAQLNVIQGSKDLSKVLWSVVERPSWLGVILKGGEVSVSIDPRFEAAAAVPAELPPPLESLSACRFPMMLEVNGDRALDCELTVCPSAPPLHLGGGIIRLVGVHPNQRERRVTIELVGARGPAAPALATNP